MNGKPPRDAIILFDGTSLKHWESMAKARNSGIFIQDRYEVQILYKSPVFDSNRNVEIRLTDEVWRDPK